MPLPRIVFGFREDFGWLRLGLGILDKDSCVQWLSQIKKVKIKRVSWLRGDQTVPHCSVIS